MKRIKSNLISHSIIVKPNANVPGCVKNYSLFSKKGISSSDRNRNAWTICPTVRLFQFIQKLLECVCHHINMLSKV